MDAAQSRPALTRATGNESAWRVASEGTSRCVNRRADAYLAPERRDSSGNFYRVAARRRLNNLRVIAEFRDRSTFSPARRAGPSRADH